MTEERKATGRKKYKILPLTEKRKAVELFQSGQVPIGEIAKQFDVQTTTIITWVKQVELGVDRLSGGYKVPTDEFRLKVVRSVLSGNLTVEEAAVVYKIRAKETIPKWIKKFGSEFPELHAPEDAGMGRTRKNSKIRKEESLPDQTLEQALADAKLKIIALETMITIAEEQLKIDIRKKSGTKQSE